MPINTLLTERAQLAFLGPCHHREYDDGIALALGEHAASVYAPGDDYWQAVMNAGWDGAVTVCHGATQIGIAYRQGSIVIAARGSSERGDWLENLSAWTTPWPFLLPRPEIRVHRGFRKQFSRIQADLAYALGSALRVARDRAGRRKTEVWVTGHSLGGALALLAVPWLANSGIVPTGVYTFNAPRVGKAPWAEWYGSTWGDVTHRVVAVRSDVQDLVSRLPFYRWGWRHVGAVQAILNGTRSAQPDEVWNSIREARSVSPLDAIRAIVRFPLSLAAHSAGALLEQLRTVDAIRSSAVSTG